MRVCGGMAPATPGCNAGATVPAAAVGVVSLGFLRLVLFGRRLAAAALSTFTTPAPAAAPAPANLIDDSYIAVIITHIQNVLLSTNTYRFRLATVLGENRVLFEDIQAHSQPLPYLRYFSACDTAFYVIIY